MTHRTALLTCLALFMLIVATPAPAQASRYEELMASPGAAKTVQDIALVILATPLRRDKIDEKMGAIWWANNPTLRLDAAERNMAMSDLKNQLDVVEEVAGREKLRKLDFVGFSKVGTQRNLEFYYASDSARGPIVFRLSLSFGDDGKVTLHGVKVFEGFDASRGAVAEIQHHAGQRVASYTIDPDKKDDEDGGDHVG